MELDSDLHNYDDTRNRDEQKNRIFATTGVPLLRIRIHGKPTTEEIRQQLCNAIDKALTEARSTGNGRLRAYAVVLLEETLAPLRDQIAADERPAEKVSP